MTNSRLGNDELKIKTPEATVSKEAIDPPRQPGVKSRRVAQGDTTETKSKKRRTTVSSGSSVSSLDSTMEDNEKLMLAKPVKKAGKKQMRYEPDIPMSKEEASAWRRKQRRLRNRESAAASRQKTRDRISELEAELEVWKSRFASLENQIKVSGSTPCVSAPKDADFDACKILDRPPSSLPTKVEFSHGIVSPPSSPTTRPSKIVIPESVVSDPSKFGQDAVLGMHKAEDKAHKKQHINEMISRPAVKITDAAPTVTLSPAKSVPAQPRPYLPSVVTSDSSVTDDSSADEGDLKPNPVLPVLSGPSLLNADFIDELLFDALSTL